MTDYINRDDAIALAKDIIVPTKSGNDYRHRCIDPQDIAELPAADVVERKTGTWCADYDGYADGEPVYDMWWCSACGEYFDEWDDKPTWKYCPVCGSYNGGDNDV